MNEIIERMRAAAINAADAAGRAAGSMSNAAQNVYENAKLRMLMFDINTDVELLYRDIGKIVYLTHTGQEIDSSEIEKKIKTIDEKMASIEAIKLNLSADSHHCPFCSEEILPDSVFCQKCGERLD